MSRPTLEYLASSLWNQKRLFDVQLEFSEKTFFLHKLLLCQSPFLHRKLADSNSTNLCLTPPDATTTVVGMELCLASLYGIQPQLSKNNVFSVLSASHLLELEKLSEVCIKFMEEQISAEVFPIWHSSNLTWEGGKYHERVKELLDLFLCRTACRETRQILHSLPNEDLTRVLSCDILWIPSEAERFELIMEVLQAKLLLSETDGDDQEEPSTDFTSTATEFSFARAGSDFSDLNNCKSSTLDCFESLLRSSNLYYHNFSFLELLQARKRAKSFGFSKALEGIDKALWNRRALELMIFQSAWRRKELAPVLPLNEATLLDSTDMLNDCSDLEESFTTLRFSTEIDDIRSFSNSGQFASEQVYFAGSLFQVVLSIVLDEVEDTSTIGIYLQRMMVSGAKSCTFADPRSGVDVGLEFIAGTYTIEVIELDGRLESPSGNRGYSKFLPFSQLSKYLSPTGTLRVTVILKMLFP